MNWVDIDLNNQHCKDMIRDAQQYHLAQQVSCQQHTPRHSQLLAKLLAFLGKLMIYAGEKLQKRYGTMTHPETYKPRQVGLESD